MPHVVCRHDVCTLVLYFITSALYFSSRFITECESKLKRRSASQSSSSAFFPSCYLSIPYLFLFPDSSHILLYFPPLIYFLVPLSFFPTIPFLLYSTRLSFHLSFILSLSFSLSLTLCCCSCSCSCFPFPLSPLLFLPLPLFHLSQYLIFSSHSWFFSPCPSTFCFPHYFSPLLPNSYLHLPSASSFRNAPTFPLPSLPPLSHSFSPFHFLTFFFPNFCTFPIL